MCPEPAAATEYEIAFPYIVADLNDVLPRRDSALYFNHPIAQVFRVFDHNHGIAAGREHAAGRNTHGRAVGHCLHCLFPHLHGTDNLYIRGQRSAGAEGIFRFYGVTIHGGAMKMREIDLRIEILSENPPSGLDGIQRFGAHRRRTE